MYRKFKFTSKLQITIYNNKLQSTTMKRKSFLKNLLALTGGGLLVSCESDVITDFISIGLTEDIEIEDAQKWFNNTYLKSFHDSKLRENPHKYQRLANWDKAKKIKDSKSQDCILVPIDYETEGVPCFLDWDENTAYKEKMAKNYAQPIVESLLVYKEKEKYTSFLFQIAYDRYKVKKKNQKIDVNKLTGWIIKADWGDTILEATKLIEGKVIGSYSSTKKGRPNHCFPVTSSYNTVTGSSCGPNCINVTVTVHSYTQYFCIDQGGSIYQSVLPPDLAAGGSGYNPSWEILNQYNPKTAVCNSGSSDRQIFNDSINQALYATGLATNVSGWSLDKADAIARSVGGNLSDFKGLINGVGVAGIVIDTVQLGIGLWDGNVTFEEDGLNAIQVGLGIVGLVAGGWIAVGAGAVSIGIAVYSQTTSNQPVCQ